MRSSMVLALLEGSVTREQLIATRGAAFRAAFNRNNYEARGFALSLDEPMAGGQSWHDVLSEDRGFGRMT